MTKILIFGDIFGKAGRRALAEVMPGLKNEYMPDIVIANVENLAHGKGVTESTLRELKDMGVDVFTSGNHVYDKPKDAEVCFDKFPELIRPANYADNLAGKGWCRVEKSGQGYLIVNLGGQVFFENQYKAEIRNPFIEADRVITEHAKEDDIIIVDFHAEATSEKQALGFHLDGRVAVVYGTHTHTPTSDIKILPNGTAYVTDAGMTGSVNSVIGVKIENAMRLFLEGSKFQMEPEEERPYAVNAIVLETAGDKVKTIERIYKEIK